MRIIDFVAGAGLPDRKISNRWVDAVRITEGARPFSIVCIHQRATDPNDGPVFGEAVSKLDHLFVLLSGQALVSGGGRSAVPVEAGKGIYWPRSEGYLISATTHTTALLIEGDFEVNPYFGMW